MSRLKKLTDRLSFNRLILYLIVIGSLPALCAAFHYMKKQKEWEEVSTQIWHLYGMSEAKIRKQYLNTIVRNVYAESDQFYLENQLENLTFLKKEKETLEQLFQNPSFTGNEAAEKRYHYLLSPSNRLEFVQGNMQAAEGIQEAICCLSHPVEVDAHDLKEVLTRVEGNRKGKPQLIVTDFRLNKKMQPGGNEVFELNMKVLKREFTP